MQSDALLSICVPRLLNVALEKKENEEAQKEVENALVALSSVWMMNKKTKKMCSNDIKEIIQYHQENHNLTRLAYQSAWQSFKRIGTAIENIELEEKRKRSERRGYIIEMAQLIEFFSFILPNA
ncbi:uncharacterized protein MONOS_11123 [Monocercomonoides exilis]|uniref:uncharacterized protein n=1 Tax=Monocercomonoides exilis TaxID=2049356 RepID=UPI003559E0D1|nr:hypothetical protein MONOS_11123 [Monocercomonoides exilis]|eukprot:MONOS_11123.1-p1 / transcript=MONOS_11123.1 / gene=MONOS_11123 / organism=Monocercomonoides_exilis_PA203 / gene_product=unspecified product / transcript_product=unspecified product / location=Mono_scaffold00541:4854-5369(+) / protein_length=124 / sequence_SO=supercontig / SO=protein_coding / is_pseudo=false